ncbi:DUF4124 domain-containing protein [Candidatus Nitrospira nitrificans]|uniref:DUF4124 domain-containing protein n=1 Tax=Candidatus Nitrospira nitrificans TaxID=1742973 RepID=A0A0S4LI97_9BACT|nr:DUF4124 domain-containing protein [Candidatus Nitrospira nitrificans]CUS36649.1 exported hypothetical protein [Candidatus Nitrospira nitrificans]
MKVLILSLVSGLFLWPMVGSAELYKWTDEQGNFHITDTPPPGAKKESTTLVVPAPHSILSKKATVRTTPLGQPQAEVQPVPGPLVPSPAYEEVPTQRPTEGLSPSQATLTSSWHIFDSTQMDAKASVQRWKDERGLDHLVDVLPATPGHPEAASKLEDLAAPHSTHRAKARATGVSRPRHQAAE